MYTFSRKIVEDGKGIKRIFDSYEMVTGEKRILDGRVLEEVKAGHVEAGMLLDPEFKQAYDAFLLSLAPKAEVVAVKDAAPLEITEGETDEE